MDGLALPWPLPGATGLRDALLAAWTDPGRGYHDLRHLSEVLARIQELAESGAELDRTVVVLAAWFHDAVYDAGPDAEERSARWAEQALTDLDLDPRSVAEVARLVRLTETHRPADDDASGCVLSDADLAILAATTQRYAEYVAAVRAEYAHVPDEHFRSGRATILRELLDKPHLFHTGHARLHWEERARANVASELSTLDPG